MKGARTLQADVAIHGTFLALDEVRWRPFDNDRDYEYYYAEERLYVIRNRKYKTCFFIKAGSPDLALEAFKHNTDEVFEKAMDQDDRP